MEAVCKEDLSETILLLAHSEKKDVNEHDDDDLMRSPLHISCCKGNVVITLLLIWVRSGTKPFLFVHYNIVSLVNACEKIT